MEDRILALTDRAGPGFYTHEARAEIYSDVGRRATDRLSLRTGGTGRVPSTRPVFRWASLSRADQAVT